MTNSVCKDSFFFEKEKDLLLHVQQSLLVDNSLKENTISLPKKGSPFNKLCQLNLGTNSDSTSIVKMVKGSQGYDSNGL